MTVTVQCYWYVVDLGEQGLHKVGKGRKFVCHLKEECPAVKAVAGYLLKGGQRAPDPLHDFWPNVSPACPFWGGPTAAAQ